MARQYIKTITARDRLLKTNKPARTAISSIVSTTDGATCTYERRLYVGVRAACVIISRVGSRGRRGDNGHADESGPRCGKRCAQLRFHDASPLDLPPPSPPAEKATARQD